MKNTLRDCDIRFSAKSGGIWLLKDARPRFLPLTDCLFGACSEFSVKKGFL